MGSFANALFSGLLGWIQSAFQSLWNVFSKDPEHSFLAWIGKHWVLLAVLLCAAGLICDFGVYMLRWQPFRVWRSYWKERRRRREELEEEPAEEEAAVPIPEAEPSFRAFRRPAETPASEDSPYRRPAETLASEDSPYRRPAETPAAEDSPYRRPAETLASEDSPYRRPAEPDSFPDTDEIERRIVRSGKRRRAVRLMREFNENVSDGVPAVEDLINSEEAYFRPVYPQNWQERESGKNG